MTSLKLYSKKVFDRIHKGDTVKLRCMWSGFDHEVTIVVKEVDWYKLVATERHNPMPDCYPRDGEDTFPIAEGYRILEVNGVKF